MERIISLSDIRKALEQAYDRFSVLDEGSVDPRLKNVDDKKFGISLMLADGTVVNKGDTDIPAPLGSIVKIPVATILLSQNSVTDLVQKSGQCPCECSATKPKIPFSHRGIRAVSAIQPVGDPDSKWNFIENRMIDMIGSAPILDDALYEKMKADAAAADVENTLAADDFYLFDDAASSIDLFLRARSMQASAAQLAAMGASIAADGVNPVTGKVVFDGEISQRVVAMMAAKGPHKMTLPWNLVAGIPAKSSFGGSILAIFPGVFAIAAYAPALNSAGVSVKAAHAIMHFMNQLHISVFQSATLKIRKD